MLVKKQSEKNKRGERPQAKKIKKKTQNN